jgi:hypothetical protein
MERHDEGDNPYQTPVVVNVTESTGSLLGTWQRCVAISFAYSISAALAHFMWIACEPAGNKAISAVMLFLYVYSLPFTFPAVVFSLKTRSEHAVVYLFAFACSLLLSFCVVAIVKMSSHRRRQP